MDRLALVVSNAWLFGGYPATVHLAMDVVAVMEMAVKQRNLPPKSLHLQLNLPLRLQQQLLADHVAHVQAVVVLPVESGLCVHQDVRHRVAMEEEEITETVAIVHLQLHRLVALVLHVHPGCLANLANALQIVALVRTVVPAQAVKILQQLQLPQPQRQLIHLQLKILGILVIPHVIPAIPVTQ